MVVSAPAQQGWTDLSHLNTGHYSHGTLKFSSTHSTWLVMICLRVRPPEGKDCVIFVFTIIQLLTTQSQISFAERWCIVARWVSHESFAHSGGF